MGSSGKLHNLTEPVATFIICYDSSCRMNSQEASLVPVGGKKWGPIEPLSLGPIYASPQGPSWSEQPWERGKSSEVGGGSSAANSGPLGGRRWMLAADMSPLGPHHWGEHQCGLGTAPAGVGLTTGQKLA